MICLMKYFKVSNYVITAIKEKLSRWTSNQLETLLIKKDVSDEVFTEVVIFYVSYFYTAKFN